MQSRKNKIFSKCSYWRSEDNSCQVGGNGLFLPTTEHIETYCCTSNYHACAHVPQVEVKGAETVEAGKVENRRTYNRVRGRYPFRFYEINGDIILENRTLDTLSFTVDVSPGGIRCESQHPLSQNTPVHFSLDDDLLDIDFHGQGVVKWCTAIEQSSLYHVGIAFADKGLSPSIQSRLHLLGAEQSPQ